MSVREITEQLNEEGFKTRRGTSYSRPMIAHIIKQQVNEGLLPY
jgi:hypothetical protein